MALRMLLEDNIEVESPNQEIDKYNLVREENMTAEKNHNLIILGNNVSNNINTENFNNIDRTNNLDLENDNLKSSVNSEGTNLIIDYEDRENNLGDGNNEDSSNKLNINDKLITNDIIQTEGRTIYNLKIEIKNAVEVKQVKKRILEPDTDVIVKTDGSQETQNVFGDDCKVFRKKKFKKSKQKKSSIKPSNCIKKRVKTKETRKTNSLECSVCLQEFGSKIALHIHVRSHTKKQYKCSLCHVKFETNSDLVAHKSTHTDSFICNLCRLAFSDHCDYLIHNLAHTSNTDIICPECGLGYNKNSFKGHIYTHFDKKMTCPMCSFVTNGEMNLRSHVNSHNYKFTCVECGKVLKSKEMYEYHMGIHTGVKKYQCLYCGKCFRNKSQRLVHTRIHTDEKPFTCGICSQKFRQHTDLKRHKTSCHEPMKQFACKYCGKKYRRKVDMKSHVETHENGKKSYECPECNATYQTMQGLRNHTMYKHLTERPVECTLCNSRYVNNNTYRNHTKTKIHMRNVYGALLKKERGEE